MFKSLIKCSIIFMVLVASAFGQCGPNATRKPIGNGQYSCVPKTTLLNCPGGNCAIGATLPTVKYFGPGLNGAKCDAATDDTAALNALIAQVYAAGGGTIVFSGTCRIDGAVDLPNDGDSQLPTQPYLRLTGGGGQALWFASAVPTSPSTLDLRYDAPVGKINTLGNGVLEIDHLNLIDTGTDCAAFVHATGTFIRAHDNTIWGTHSNAAACNDVFVIGGSSSTGNPGQNPDGRSRGYGSVIRDNYADRVRVFVRGRGSSNAIQVLTNTVGVESGSSETDGAPIEIGAAGESAEGWFVAGNLLEMLYYTNGVWIGPSSNHHVLVGNSTWDGACKYGRPAITGSGLNDLSISGTCGLLTDQATIKIQIDGTGTPDTFKWARLVNGAGNWVATTVAITGAAQNLTLSDGSVLTVTFGATTGHTLNDYWTLIENFNQAYKVQGSANLVISGYDSLGGAARFGTTRAANNILLGSGLNQNPVSQNIFLPQIQTGHIVVSSGDTVKYSGTATLASGTKVVSNTGVTATSNILLTPQTCNSCGTPYVSAINAGVSFTITSTNGSDASVVYWEIR